MTYEEKHDFIMLVSILIVIVVLGVVIIITGIKV